ncbi:hypothetical protein CEP88_13385 [Roseobacter denitrificans]|nr:hypothetical protein [Roseobacter denitrificans]AVL53508.1 hypothetical protein CEP88_13385 [Roseobacter denitrificans]SFF71788.1 hypothetical protein SAMN05443635_101347 [Roseobacter denitrificans OCh 114]
MLVWNDTIVDASAPDIGVGKVPFDAQVALVLMNGRCVAQIHGDPGLDASGITVIPSSSARRIGLEPV